MLITFYGDDFTGSTDAMEALASHGIPTALFLEPPSVEETNRFRLIDRANSPDGRIQALGVPGISRSLTPDQMEQTLPSIFQKIAKIPSRFFHYKTCSTFDSSPAIGNIAAATDIALRSFPSPFVPLLVGAPGLGRYTVFGNLFAKVDSETFRIDRHPTMSKHPVTPMRESDLRQHLATLGPRPVELLDLFQLRKGLESGLAQLAKLDQSQSPFLLIDMLEDQDLRRAGKLICQSSREDRQLLVGSSGIEYALCSYLNEQSSHPAKSSFSSPGPAEQIIALSGSAAPGTGQQIRHALESGFADVRIHTLDLLDPYTREREMERVIDAATEALSSGRSPMIYTAIGPDDPALEQTRQAGVSKTLPIGQTIAAAQGTLLRKLLQRVGTQRVVVAGGDTSGYATKALDVHALEIRFPIAPGAPLCIAHSHDPAFHGMEIALKGGQNGKQNYFESILLGVAL